MNNEQKIKRKKMFPRKNGCLMYILFCRKRSPLYYGDDHRFLSFQVPAPDLVGIVQ